MYMGCIESCDSNVQYNDTYDTVHKTTNQIHEREPIIAIHSVFRKQIRLNHLQLYLKKASSQPVESFSYLHVSSK